tara:strand:+ start:70 stop:981 length:912 start_codon:yes stop_codon:yes gene_type:complete
MSWPKRTWTADGWKDFKTPGRGDPKGFPDDWRQHESSVDNSSFWDVLDNPLYEAAANASGIDWEQWVADSTAAIGTEEDYGANEYVRVQTSAGGRRRTGRSGFTEVDPTYDVMTRQEAYDAGYTDEHIAAGSGSSGRDRPDWHGDEPFISGFEDGDDDDSMDWGISRGSHGSVAEDLDTMHSWLQQTIKTHSLQDMPIVNRGPEGSDYGIDGDIWAHYGLDKPPKPPKEMDVNYEFKYAQLKPSNATYDTPKHLGFKRLGINVPDEGAVAYEDTHYAHYLLDKKQEAQAAEFNYENTSYGELT